MKQKIISNYYNSLLVLLFFYSSLFFTFPLIAEEKSPKLQGLSKAEVIAILGPPNRSSSIPSGSNSYSSETLYYGESQITVINNKVSSIFDMGEIKKLNSKKNKRQIPEEKWIKWPNPWTPPE